jgi:DNA-directed RNA polymerase I subunit RPA49
MLQQRQALGMEFGTKKSKKMIQSLTENAIIASSSNKQSTATKALMASIGENIANMPTVEDLQTLAEESKPRPKANLSATDPTDVYPIQSLIDEDTLYSINVQDWKDATKEKVGVTTTSRYVSRRLQSVLQNDDEAKMKVLKYMLMVIEFFQLSKKSKNGNLVPRGNDLHALDHPGFLLEGVKKRFSVDKYVFPCSLINAPADLYLACLAFGQSTT